MIDIIGTFGKSKITAIRMNSTNNYVALDGASWKFKLKINDTTESLKSVGADMVHLTLKPPNKKTINRAIKTIIAADYRITDDEIPVAGVAAQLDKGELTIVRKGSSADILTRREPPKPTNTDYNTCSKCGFIHGDGGCIE